MDFLVICHRNGHIYPMFGQTQPLDIAIHQWNTPKRTTCKSKKAMMKIKRSEAMTAMKGPHSNHQGQWDRRSEHRGKPKKNSGTPAMFVQGPCAGVSTGTGATCAGSFWRQHSSVTKDMHPKPWNMLRATICIIKQSQACKKQKQKCKHCNNRWTTLPPQWTNANSWVSRVCSRANPPPQAGSNGARVWMKVSFNVRRCRRIFVLHLQRHPAACPLQSAHATLTAAPSSSTLKQHPAAACCSGTRSGTSMPARKHDCDSSTLKGVPSRQLESGRHSNSSTLKQHLVAAPCRGTTIPAPKRTHSDSRASKHIHHSDSRCTLQRHQHARSKFTVMVFETSQGWLFLSGCLHVFYDPSS